MEPYVSDHERARPASTSLLAAELHFPKREAAARARVLGNAASLLRRVPVFTMSRTPPFLLPR